MVGKPSKPKSNPSNIVGCIYPEPLNPTHTRTATEKQGLTSSDRFFFIYLKTKSTSPKQKIRLNKIYSEYTQQTSVCAIKYCVCYCGTNLKHFDFCWIGGVRMCEGGRELRGSQQYLITMFGARSIVDLFG